MTRKISPSAAMGESLTSLRGKVKLAAAEASDAVGVEDLKAEEGFRGNERVIVLDVELKSNDQAAEDAKARQLAADLRKQYPTYEGGITVSGDEVTIPGRMVRAIGGYNGYEPR